MFASSVVGRINYLCSRICPMEMFRSGDLKGAVENLDGKLRSNRDNAILQHTYAEFANMLNMEEQDDVVPGTKIMMSKVLLESESLRSRFKA